MKYLREVIVKIRHAAVHAAVDGKTDTPSNRHDIGCPPGVAWSDQMFVIDNTTVQHLVIFSAVAWDTKVFENAGRSPSSLGDIRPVFKFTNLSRYSYSTWKMEEFRFERNGFIDSVDSGCGVRLQSEKSHRRCARGQ